MIHVGDTNKRERSSYIGHANRTAFEAVFQKLSCSRVSELMKHTSTRQLRSCGVNHAQKEHNVIEK